MPRKIVIGKRRATIHILNDKDNLEHFANFISGYNTPEAQAKQYRALGIIETIISHHINGAIDSKEALRQIRYTLEHMYDIIL